MLLATQLCPDRPTLQIKSGKLQAPVCACVKLRLGLLFMVKVPLWVQCVVSPLLARLHS